MDMLTWTALAAAATVNAAIPGPCVALTMARTATGGVKAALMVTVGMLLADIVLVGLAAAVLHGALEMTNGALGGVRVVGCGVLIALGIGMLRPRATLAKASVAPTKGSDLMRGFAVGCTSPFNYLFFLALLPLYLPATELDVATISAVVAAAALATVIAGAGAAGISLATLSVHSGVGRWMERAGALSLFAFAAVTAGAPMP